MSALPCSGRRNVPCVRIGCTTNERVVKDRVKDTPLFAFVPILGKTNVSSAVGGCEHPAHSDTEPRTCELFKQSVLPVVVDICEVLVLHFVWILPFQPSSRFVRKFAFYNLSGTKASPEEESAQLGTNSVPPAFVKIVHELH